MAAALRMRLVLLRGQLGLAFAEESTETDFAEESTEAGFVEELVDVDLLENYVPGPADVR